MNSTIDFDKIIATRIKAYRQGKDCNEGGLSFMVNKDSQYYGRYIGFFMNATIVLDKEFHLIKIKIKGV